MFGTWVLIIALLLALLGVEAKTILVVVLAIVAYKDIYTAIKYKK